MVKILHLADIHLDSPFKKMSYSDSVKRRADTRKVFSDALGYAQKSGVSVVLLSGDLFDSEFYTENTITFLSDSFKNMPDCRFIISPGNHDPYKYGSPYTENVFSKNVFIFNSEDLQEITFKELGLTVYGYAFTSESHIKRPIEGFKVSKDGFNVLCAHTEIDTPFSNYAPISTAELSNSGLDYAALGHIHTDKEIRKASGTVYAYSGCLTGRDFSEHGDCGGILITLDVINGRKTIDAERAVFCPWVYKTITVNLNGSEKDYDLKNYIVKRISDETGKTEKEYILRIILTGNTDREVNEKAMTNDLSEYGVKEIENRMISNFDFLGLNDDFSIRGEFYRTLKPMLSSENPEERRKAEAALKFGLDALNRKELE